MGANVPLIYHGILVIFLLDYVLLNCRQAKKEKQLKPGV